jgi:predicted Zn-dependent peptidase
VRTREVEQPAEKRMIAYAETNPEVNIQYHSVADGHVDEPALVVMGSLLSGRTGRLYKSLVLDQKIANEASAGQNGMKWDGYFAVSGTAKPEVAPEQVEQALYREIEKLQKERVPDRELQKVKNRFAADNFRRVQGHFYLMMQLLVADNNRGWRSFNEDPQKIAAVTPEDIQRVASRYFAAENRAVALYYTKKSEPEAEDPLLSGLNDQEKAQIRQFRTTLAQVPREQALALLQKIEQQGDKVPPEMKKTLEVMKKLLQDKIAKDGGR